MPTGAPRGESLTAPTRGRPRRCGAAHQDLCFLPNLSGTGGGQASHHQPRAVAEPHARHLTMRGVNSGEFGVESTRRFGPRAGLRPSRVPKPHGRTHSLFTMSKNTPRTRRRGDAPAGSAGGEFCGCGRWIVGLLPGLPVSRPSRPASPGGHGGARRDRTDDLMLAKHALSQLSYCPSATSSAVGQGGSLGRVGSGLHDWWAWEDSNFRPHAYQARALTN